MRIPGRKLIVRSSRWARSRVTGGVVVLGYHRVSDDTRDPFDLAITPDTFTAHMQFLAQYAQPLRLSDAAAALSEGKLPARSVAVTFDDGYGDTAERVLPVLERFRIPATVFVTTGNLGREYWWDELTRIVLDTTELASPVRLRLADSLHSWPLRPDATTVTRYALLHEAADLLRRLSPAELRDAMQEVRGWRDAGSGAAVHRALTALELRQLAASPLVEIGAHTVSHPVLDRLPPGEQLNEAAQSRIALEQITGDRVTSFSYPHGSYSTVTQAAVREAGFELSCCSGPDIFTRRASRYAVPRLWADHRDERTFARWMKWWLTN